MPLPLPTLSVQIAFNPTNLQSLTQTWTDVTAYVRDFTTSSGRQHFLDRIESSTIRLTLDNRTGYFLNGTTNGTGSVIRTRLPIRVLAGWPAVNVTAISGSGTVVTYTAANTYTAGQQIIVQNATTAAFNGVFTVATATATQFTVASTATGTTSTATVAAAYPVFWGLTESAEERTADQLNQDILVTATDNTKYLSLLYMNRPTFWKQYTQTTNAVSWYRCDSTQSLPDLISGNTGTVYGSVQTTPGTIYYDTDTALDLTNATTAGTNLAYLSMPAPASIYAIDFWVIGQNLGGQNLTDVFGAASYLSVTGGGALQGLNSFSGASNPYFQNYIANVSDGNWHHVGLIGYKSGTTYPLYLYLDGTYISMGDNGAPLLTGSATTNLRIGNLDGGSQSPSYAYVDEVVMSKDAGSLAAIQAEVNNRFKAGSLLKNNIASGDRIAEVLTVAGYGTITSGALSVPNYLVDGSSWTSSNNGSCYVAGFQNAMTNSTALDLIQQVTDTDIGSFYQNPDGTVEFDSQAFDYTPSKNALPSGANVWTDTDTMTGTTFTYYMPASLSILRDDADLWTTVKITAQNGTEQTYENTSAEPLYGYSTLTKGSTVHTTNEAAYQTAVYLGNLYQAPIPRVQTLELQSETGNGANLAQMLNQYINDEVLVIRNENGASTSGKINLRMVIESVRHDFKADPGQWHTEFTLDPYPLQGQNAASPSYFMLFDDATYGRFDTNNTFL